MDVSEVHGLGVERRFTRQGQDPYESVEWERRVARITNFRTGEVAFEQSDVEVPVSWSLNATNILAQKYFRGTLGAPTRENSLKQVADRIVDTLTGWGVKDGYFCDAEEAEVFRAELKYLLIHQQAAFNSPVWFNIGVPGVPQQGSACFILSVEDTMDSILNWYREEGVIFKGGSGAGVNLSAIRSSLEHLNGGGTASGPVSFMRGADASAGTIKSGGKTRRAAKMVILDVNHPDVEEFVSTKALEERKARVLSEAGFDMGVDGKDSFSVQYQNANNSVRVTDDFMHAVLEGGEWELKAVTTNVVVKRGSARELMRKISQAAWECADPGMQYDTTINRWHTTPNAGRINGSNPCSEYMHLDNSSCNLASINLMKYLDDDDEFDVEAFGHSAALLIIAQDIIAGNADYPTETIARTSRAYRQLGLGYANLGALLMALGLPYDSDEGRSYAASVTALMTAVGYRTSAVLAARVGPFEGFAKDRDGTLRVLQMHRDETTKLDEDKTPATLLSAARLKWDEAIEAGMIHGVRNAQVSLLAPTGTIGLLMDCDTTGIEPDLGLVKFKTLVGGGTMTIVNQTVPRALSSLGYGAEQVAAIIEYIDEHKTIVGAPDLRDQDLPVFACAMGDNVIDYRGHIRMMSAVQPFLSGAISKTVNLPETATVEDIEDVFIEGWRLGLKAVAIYRDNCKVGQPLQTMQKDKLVDTLDLEKLEALREQIDALTREVEHSRTRPVRERLPRHRRARTYAFQVADAEGYVTVGEYDDGRPGEVFIKVSKQGSTLAGVMDAFSISVSLGLQHGVPLETFVRKYVNMRFEPAGITDDREIRLATSLVDYIFRRLAVDYLERSIREDLGIHTTGERTQDLLFPAEDGAVQRTVASIDQSYGVAEQPLPQVETGSTTDASYCYSCGNVMQRAGSCFVCPSCGSTSGCS
ncbi:MAG: vitamin B12-dependent ribonucleotide reductase [Ferrimicrobium sp.]